MSQWNGEVLRLKIEGASHDEAIYFKLEGLPAGTVVSWAELRELMDRRRPGRSGLTSQRQEADIPEFQSGIRQESDSLVTDGEPICGRILNRNAHGADYDALAFIPRPGHADWPAYVKYGQERMTPGGGAFSGRMTAATCAAGAFALTFLKKQGIQVCAEIDSLGGCRKKEYFEELVQQAKEEGDSLGGTVSCRITGLPVGLGGPLFEGLDGKIAALIFAIPAVKGIEFGEGFCAAERKGSENNDAYEVNEGKISLLSNHCGGILGGMSTGTPLIFRTAFKPTPSISKAQQSINVKTGENVRLEITGRHDPCIVLRAAPIVEATAALAIADAYLAALADGSLRENGKRVSAQNRRG